MCRLEEIIKTIGDSLAGWIQQFGGGFINFIAGNIDKFNVIYRFGQTNPKFDNTYQDWLWAVHLRVVVFTWLILFLRLLVDGIRLYLAREAGEQILSPMVSFRRLAITVVSMAIVTYGFTYGHHNISATMGELIKINARAASSLQGAHKQAVYDVADDKSLLPDMGNWLADFNKYFVYKGVAPGTGPSPTMNDVGETLFRIGIALSVTMGILTFFVQQALREFELVFAWLVGPLACLSAMSTDDPLREGALSLWLREVMVVSFNHITTMVILIMFHELIDPKGLVNLNTSTFTAIVSLLALIAIGTQGPRALRHYAWGNQQGQMLASQLVRMPW